MAVEPGRQQWVAVPLSWQPDQPCNAFVVVDANPDVHMHMSDDAAPGVLWFANVTPDRPPRHPQPLLEWRELHHHEVPCLRSNAVTEAYHPGNAVGGYARPFSDPQIWASQPLHDLTPEWLELTWPQPVDIGEVQLIFDDDINENLNNLHCYRTPEEVMPTLVRDYRIEARVNGVWTVLASENDNRWRRRATTLDSAVAADAVRIVVEATKGARRAHIVAARVYGP